MALGDLAKPAAGERYWECMSSVTLLAIDDDPVQLEIIAAAAHQLEYPQITVLPAASVEEANTLLEHNAPDMVICDNFLPDGSGRDILQAMRHANPLVPVIIITAHESVAGAVDLLKCGARDYLVKPLKSREIQQVIAATLAWHSEEQDFAALSRQHRDGEQDPAGESPATSRHLASSGDLPDITDTVAETMKTALRLAVRGANSVAAILIQGESGTGKELLARLIHERSPRSHGPFVTVHMAALAESLVESELFGHRQGAFTGAQGDRIGYFEQANGGTLFIDEVGEVPLSIQVKLLRALQFKEVLRVGETRPRAVDVRIVAATNRDLESMVHEGTFREDLFYRINVVTVQLPPLRDRRQDIPHMVERMIRTLALQNGRSLNGVSQRALNLLVGYRFPGNVRELENIIERAVILAKRPIITEEDLPGFVLATGTAETAQNTLDEQLESLERRLILEALEETRGNQSRAAALLGITERRLRSRLERLNLENPY